MKRLTGGATAAKGGAPPPHGAPAPEGLPGPVQSVDATPGGAGGEEPHDEFQGDSSSASASLTFGRCIHGHAEALGYPHQEYCWLEGARLKDRDELVAILDAWELEPPNLVISLVGGGKPHPRRLVISEMTAQQELQQTVQRVKASLAMALEGEPMPTSADDALPPDGALGEEGSDRVVSMLEVLGDSLFERLVTTMTALVDACARTNSWIVSQQQPDGTLMSGLSLLLEHALRRTASRPVILQICQQGAMARRPEHEQAWERLRQKAVALPGDMGTEGLLPFKVPDSIYPKGQDEPEVDSKELVHDQPYGQWPLRVASHFIFATSHQPFPLNWLGPTGSIFMSGGSGAGHTSKILMSAKLGEPTVVLKHTGRACDIWGYIIDLRLNHGLSNEEDLIARLKEKYPAWHDKDGGLYGLPGLGKELYGLVNGFLGVPLPQARSSVVVVDSWQDSPELVLRRLSVCFASSSSSSLELGAANAEDRSIAEAWRQHIVLEHNSRIFVRRGNWMTVCGLLLSFLSTVLSVCATFVETRQTSGWAHEVMSSWAYRATGFALMVLPALAGLFVTLLSRLRYLNKWATVYVAAEQLKSEIYKFRAKAGTYDTTQALTTEGKHKRKGRRRRSGKAAQPEGPVRGAHGGGSAGQRSQQASHLAREKFVAQVSSVFAGVMGAMPQDALYQPADLEAGLVLRKEAQTALFEGAAGSKRRRMSASLLPMAEWGSQRGYGSGAELLVAGDGAESGDELEPDDLVSHLSNEAYYEHRVRRLLEHYRGLAPRLANRLTLYETFIFLSSLAGTLLGAIKFKEWIPVAVALTSVFNSFLVHETLTARLATVNAAVQDLTMLVTYWTSLGVVEKRTRSVKRFLVEVAENAVMREAAAYAAGAMATGSSGASKLAGANENGHGGESTGTHDSKEEKAK